MKMRNISYALLVLLSIALLVGCEDRKQASTTASTSQNGSLAVTENAPKKASSIWPFLSEGQGNGALASDLLAKNFVLILDGSGSMSEGACKGGGSKMAIAKKAIGEWVKSLPSGSNLGLVVFHNQETWDVLDISSGPRDRFMQVVSSTSPQGNTPLATALKKAYGMLTRQAQGQLGYGEYTIVVITDGEDNDREESLNRWVEATLKTPIRIYTIGFCISSNHQLNQPGKTIYREAGNLEELKKSLEEVAAEAETYDVTGFKK